MKVSDAKYAEAKMLIRKPAREVFDAFIDPLKTKNFWFTRGSHKLEANKKVIWEWEMYGVSVTADVKEIIPDKKIVLEWDDPPTTVEFNFEQLNYDSTYVTITESGYGLSGDELLAKIKDSTGGFTTVLDGLKAYLEHDINLNLIADKFPDKIRNKDYV
ncbi:MAG TPA: SRPBCC family protein [Chitinophagaceae bacterium]|nr:SRPBCC family protein [Chitinophagaceae bacterium]